MSRDRTALPAVWLVTAGVLGICAGVVAALSQRWFAVALLAGSAAMFAGAGVYTRKHAADIAARGQARRERTRASMRRHPVLWVLLVPAFAAIDGALRWNRTGHHSASSTAIWAGGSALFGLAVAVFAIRRARRERR